MRFLTTRLKTPLLWTDDKWEATIKKVLYFMVLVFFGIGLFFLFAQCTFFLRPTPEAEFSCSELESRFIGCFQGSVGDLGSDILTLDLSWDSSDIEEEVFCNLLSGTGYLENTAEGTRRDFEVLGYVEPLTEGNRAVLDVWEAGGNPLNSAVVILYIDSEPPLIIRAETSNGEIDFPLGTFYLSAHTCPE